GQRRVAGVREPLLAAGHRGRDVSPLAARFVRHRLAAGRRRLAVSRGERRVARRGECGRRVARATLERRAGGARRRAAVRGAPGARGGGRQHRRARRGDGRAVRDPSGLRGAGARSPVVERRPAPVFFGASPVAVRLTAVAALADVARLLVFPLTLRVDYSPAERTLVSTLLDYRFALGLLCVAAWSALLWLTWRRGRRVEAFGLGWIAIALFPVSNLVVPVGVLLAERARALPSAGRS